MFRWKRFFLLSFEQFFVFTELELESADQTVKVLNVGFGMGIVDGLFQEILISNELKFEHHVIEGHPDVLKRIPTYGYKNLVVHEGTWQKILPNLTDQKFDIVYFDTYAEYDDSFFEFLSFLPKIMKETGKFSFFNGNCPDNIFFHGVACEVIRLKMVELGMSVVFSEMEIDANKDKIWEDVKRRYWFRKSYYLPLAKFE